MTGIGKPTQPWIDQESIGSDSANYYFIEQVQTSVRSNFWVWVPHNSLSLSFSGAWTQKEWVEFALRFLSPAYLFFCNNKKGSVSPMDISDLALEKREGEFTTTKWGRVGIQKAFWENDWVERRLFYLILCTVQSQFFLVEWNSKNLVWVGFFSKVECARGKSADDITM